MVDFVNALAVLKSSQNQLLYQLNALLLELCEETEEFEPIVGLQRIVRQSDVSILPKPFERSHVLLHLKLFESKQCYNNSNQQIYVYHYRE
jgi:hypothetical protein